MEPREVHERRDEVQILDVREPYEWDAGHIAGADHIPMGELADRQPEIATDRPVVCVCRSGARSGVVANALVRAGYDAHNMEGGMVEWRHRGLPMRADGDADPEVA